jgi:hypothetical protein
MTLSMTAYTSRHVGTNPAFAVQSINHLEIAELAVNHSRLEFRLLPTFQQTGGRTFSLISRNTKSKGVRTKRRYFNIP